MQEAGPCRVLPGKSHFKGGRGWEEQQGILESFLLCQPSQPRETFLRLSTAGGVHPSSLHTSPVLPEWRDALGDPNLAAKAGGLRAGMPWGAREEGIHPRQKGAQEIYLVLAQRSTCTRARQRCRFIPPRIRGNSLSSPSPRGGLAGRLRSGTSSPPHQRCGRQGGRAPAALGVLLRKRQAHIFPQNKTRWEHPPHPFCFYTGSVPKKNGSRRAWLCGAHPSVHGQRGFERLHVRTHTLTPLLQQQTCAAGNTPERGGRLCGCEVVCVLPALGDRQEQGSSSAESGGAEGAGSAPSLSWEPSSWCFPPGRWRSRVKNCQSQDCTIQHCGRVKEWEETRTKMGNALSRSRWCLSPTRRLTGCGVQGSPRCVSPSHRLPWRKVLPGVTGCVPCSRFLPPSQERRARSNTEAQRQWW